jgi:hypothetical protein
MLRRVVAKMFKGKGKATSAAALPSGAEIAQVAGAHQAQIDEEAELQAQIDAAAFKETTKKAAVLVKRLKDNIDKDPVIPSHIVRGWVNE